MAQWDVIEENRKKSFGDQLLSGLDAAQPGIKEYFDKQSRENQIRSEDEKLKKMGIDLSGIRDPDARKLIISETLKSGTQKQKTANDLEAGESQVRARENQIRSEDEKLKKMGIDLSGIRDPDVRKLIISETLKSGTQKQKTANDLEAGESQVRDIAKKLGLEEDALDAYASDPNRALQVGKAIKEKAPSKTALTAQEVPPDVSRKIKKIIADNPKASSDQLRIEMDEAGIPPIYSNPYTENRRRTEEQGSKSQEDYLRELRKETLPVRTKIAEKAMAAEQGIQNKEQLLNLIEKGDINDPTYAALAENLPLNLGKRLLSNDTVEYKAGLIEEFGDLRNIFQGQTRVKELELLEQKIADLYLDDEQKKAILKSRINALKADVIKAEVAQELENEPLGILQFQQEVDKRSKPKLESLFNQILDEQKSIIQNAENKKKVPLDINDPEDKRIMEQIKKEAKGDSRKALELAKKKGYIFK